jgi:hypothetical protein
MSLIFHDEGMDVTELVRSPLPQSTAAPVSRPTHVVSSHGRKNHAPAEETVPVERQSLAVQAEPGRPIDIIRHSEITSPVGELSLTFNSPMKLSMPIPQEVKPNPPVPKVSNDRIPRAIPAPQPVEAPKEVTEQLPPSKPEPVIRDDTAFSSESSWGNPRHHELCFIDEVDLDDSDDLMIVCRRAQKDHNPPVETVPIKPLRQISQPKVSAPVSQEKSTNKSQKDTRPAEDTPLKKRFARYADFNWY